MSGNGSLPSWYLMMVSQSDTTLKYTSLLLSRIASCIADGNRPSAVMNHRKIWVSSNSLMCPRNRSEPNLAMAHQNQPERRTRQPLNQRVAVLVSLWQAVSAPLRDVQR